MNIIDFRQTSLCDNNGTAARRSPQHGAAITHTELVGLIPQAALIDYALASLQLPATNARSRA